MSLDHHNFITAKDTGLIFHCSMSLWPKRRLLPYNSIYNAFSWANQCLPLCSIHLWLSTWWLHITEICIIHSGYFDCRVASCQFILLSNRLNKAGTRYFTFYYWYVGVRNDLDDAFTSAIIISKKKKK